MNEEHSENVNVMPLDKFIAQHAIRSNRHMFAVLLQH